MSIDWTKPVIVTGLAGRPHLTNAPPTPQIGPEHIEALAEAIDDYGEWPHPHDEMKVARLAEIRAYLESL